MRQRLGQRKINKYAKATGLPVVKGLTRGGTGHRVDLFLEDGSHVMYWPKTGELMTPAERAKVDEREELTQRRINRLAHFLWRIDHA